MYLWIVRLLTLIPSLSNSPRILSAPHVELLDAIERINAPVSAGRRFAERGRLRQRHRALKPARCQRRSVSGWTMRSAFLHVGVKAASATNTIRSSRVTLGLATDRCRMATWWRSKATSASKDRRDRSKPTTAAASMVMPANMVR
jgi:hypothetical protein